MSVFGMRRRWKRFDFQFRDCLVPGTPYPSLEPFVLSDEFGFVLFATEDGALILV